MYIINVVKKILLSPPRQQVIYKRGVEISRRQQTTSNDVEGATLEKLQGMTILDFQQVGVTLEEAHQFFGGQI